MCVVTPATVADPNRAPYSTAPENSVPRSVLSRSSASSRATPSVRVTRPNTGARWPSSWSGEPGLTEEPDDEPESEDDPDDEPEDSFDFSLDAPLDEERLSVL